jgi:hypothetical protein
MGSACGKPPLNLLEILVEYFVWECFILFSNYKSFTPDMVTRVRKPHSCKGFEILIECFASFSYTILVTDIILHSHD